MRLATRFGTHRKWLIPALVLAGLWYAWSRITAPTGVQKVAFVPAKESCGSVGRLRYCIFRDRTGSNGDVVYHLHGRNLDEHAWNDDTYWTAQVQADWQRTGTSPPTVVTVSYGPDWLLAPKGQQAGSGLLEDFMARLPEIEARTGRPRRRILLGESMGGLNVLIAGLSHPGSFAKVAALCPGVYAVSPFAPLSVLRDAMRRTGADPKIGFGIWVFARKYVASDAEWQGISPLALVDRPADRHPALYLSNGLYDAYGNFEGTERLARAASRKGIPVEWHPLYGGHCAIDISSLARFLAS